MVGKTNVFLIARHALLCDMLETLLTSNARLRLYHATAGDYRNVLPKIHQHGGPVAVVVEKEAFGKKIAELASLLLEFELAIIQPTGSVGGGGWVQTAVLRAAHLQSEKTYDRECWERLSPRF